MADPTERPGPSEPSARGRPEDATYPGTVRERGPRRFSYAVLALLVLPFVTLAIAGYVFLSPSGKAESTPVALGSLKGGFHPVAGSFKPDGTVLGDCGDSDYICLEQGFGNVAYRQGPTVALALFTKRMGSDKSVFVDCHRIAHSIGSGSFARFHGNVAKAFSLGSSTCASGYYHGILERAFVGVTSKAGLERVARRLCVAKTIRPRSYLDYQCQHGLGHGLMIESGYDLPLALNVCSKLANGWDHVVCTSGVFMENINTRYGFRSPYVKDSDPLYPCATVRLVDRRSCYVRSTSRVLDVNHYDFPKTAATCAGLSRPWTRYCYRGFGRDSVNQAHYRASGILSLCHLAKSYEPDCLFGAARTVGDGFGYAGVERAAALCKRAPAASRRGCFGGVGLVVGLLTPTDARRARTCGRLAGGYAAVCAQEAVAEVQPDGRGAWG